MGCGIMNERLFYQEGSASGRNKLNELLVYERGAEKREQPGGVKSISSTGVVTLRINVSASVMTSALWLQVKSLSAVTCSGVSMERVLRVQMRMFEVRVGLGFGWIPPQRSFWKRAQQHRTTDKEDAGNAQDRPTQMYIFQKCSGSHAPKFNLCFEPAKKICIGVALASFSRSCNRLTTFGFVGVESCKKGPRLKQYDD